MKFINRLVLFYALIVIVLTAAYFYVATHFLVDSKGNASIWWLALFLALVYGSGMIISARDENSAYIGCNYHLVTYLIVVLSTLGFVLTQSSGATRQENLQGILQMVVMWGTGLLFHFGFYFFFARKKKIGSYEKDDVFK